MSNPNTPRRFMPQLRQDLRITPLPEINSAEPQQPTTPLRRTGPSLSKPPGNLRPEDQYDELGWSYLPEHILEQIFLSLQDEHGNWPDKKVLFSICGVCQTWRRVAQPLFFSGAWDLKNAITHPAQLLSVSPNPVEGGLVRCFLQREEVQRGPLGQLHRFALYMGSEPGRLQNAQFMMAADQLSRSSYQISLAKDVAGSVVARLQGNLLRSQYRLVPDKSTYVRRLLVQSGFGHMAPGSCLLRVAYQMRMRGIMLPRRIKVELPTSRNLEPGPLFASMPLPSPSRRDLDVPLVAEEQGYASGLHSVSQDQPRMSEPGGPSHSLARSSLDLGSMLSRSSHGHHSFRCSDDGATSTTSSGNSVPVLKLQNKPPHWNEALKCWCLNFRGRVKMASVKNFQLMCSQDSAGRIMMQFGKVDDNTFILDFNPCVMTTLQAFATCLTAFETKYLL